MDSKKTKMLIFNIVVSGSLFGQQPKQKELNANQIISMCMMPGFRVET